MIGSFNSNGKTRISLYYLLLSICVICIIIRTVYEILKYKGKIKGDNHFYFIFIIITMVILFGSWIRMSKNDPYKILTTG